MRLVCAKFIVPLHAKPRGEATKCEGHRARLGREDQTFRNRNVFQVSGLVHENEHITTLGFVFNPDQGGTVVAGSQRYSNREKCS